MPGSDPQNLNRLADAVQGAAASIEETFLDLGMMLGEALDIVGQVTGNIETIPQTLTGEEMISASETLWRIASELSGVSTALPQERESLERISVRLEGLRTPLDRLVSSIRTIAILARSARVETAYLPRNQLNFTEFAEEILTLADEARSGISAYARDYSSLATLLNAAREAQAGFDEDRRAQIESSVSELQSAFDAIETRQHEAVKVAAQIADRSRAVSSVMGDAIMALQAGDSTRQRLEHVDHALHDAVNEPDAAAGICAVQGAQLADAMQDFDAAVANTRGSLASLATDAVDMVGLGQSLVGVDGDASTLHERLRERLNMAAALVRDCEIARSSVDRVLSSLSATLFTFRDRLATLQRISTSITTVGLNAAVKSYRLGQDGKALAIISQDLRQYAEQIVDDTKALLGVFEEVLAMAETIEAARVRQDASHMARADSDIADMLATLAHNESLVSNALGGISRAGSQVAAVLDRAEQRFSELDVAMAPVHAAAQELDALGRLAGGGGKALAQAGRYTMERERRIHEAIAARG